MRKIIEPIPLVENATVLSMVHVVQVIVLRMLHLWRRMMMGLVVRNSPSSWRRDCRRKAVEGKRCR
jgi:hypothetical protein